MQLFFIVTTYSCVIIAHNLKVGLELRKLFKTNLEKLNDWLNLDNNEKFQTLNYILPVIQTISLDEFI